MDPKRATGPLDPGSRQLEAQIEELVADDRLDDALEVLKRIHRTKAVRLQGQLAHLDGKHELGELTPAEYGAQRARIQGRILDALSPKGLITRAENLWIIAAVALVVVASAVAAPWVVPYIAQIWSTPSTNSTAEPTRPPMAPCPEPPLYSTSDNFDEMMIEIAGGEFTMGDGGSKLTQPEHRVSVDTFFIDKYEVTNYQYQQFAKDTGPEQLPGSWSGTEYPAGQAFYPVTGVTWYDAVAYCEWAGKRLPTEAEWELACRGTEGNLYPWGQEPDPTFANTGDHTCKGVTTVGSFLAATDSEIADLIGNVNEWTHSMNWSYPYDARDGRESSDIHDDKRVIRGGSYRLEMTKCAHRLNALPQMAIPDTGFRCARSKQ